jgi:hypothetical protein
MVLMAGVAEKFLLADSNAAQANVQGILNYSQAVQYLYTKNKSQFLIYVAYCGTIHRFSGGCGYSIILTPVG